MRARKLTPGEDAQVSQWTEQMADVDRAWPANAHLHNDKACDRAIQERGEYPWQHLRPDRTFLLWPDGRTTEVQPHPDIIRAVADATLPHPNTACDRCGEQPPPLGLSMVLVARPPNIVALALCGMCVADTDPDELIPVTPESAERK